MAQSVTRIIVAATALVLATLGMADPVLPAAGYFQDACRVEDNLFGFNAVNRTFGPSGRLQLESIDTGADGSTEETREYSYDSEGRIIRVVYRRQPSAVVSQYQHNYYSEDSRLEWNKTVFLAPTTHVGHRRRIERDMEGHVIRETLFTNTPPTVIAVEDWTYDVSGLPVSRTDYFWVVGSAWELQAIHSFSHNEVGRLVLQSTDNGGDGSIDEVSRYDYDARGRLTGSETDVGADGLANWAFRRDYDDERQVVVESIDWELDGQADVQIVYYFACGE